MVRVYPGAMTEMKRFSIYTEIVPRVDIEIKLSGL